MKKFTFKTANIKFQVTEEQNREIQKELEAKGVIRVGATRCDCRSFVKGIYFMGLGPQGLFCLPNDDPIRFEKWDQELVHFHEALAMVKAADCIAPKVEEISGDEAIRILSKMRGTTVKLVG